MSDNWLQFDQPTFISFLVFELLLLQRKVLENLLEAGLHFRVRDIRNIDYAAFVQSIEDVIEILNIILVDIDECF